MQKEWQGKLYGFEKIKHCCLHRISVYWVCRKKPLGTF